MPVPQLPVPEDSAPDNGRSFGLSNSVWDRLINVAGYCLVSIVVAWFGTRNHTAIEQSSEKAAEHNDKLTAAVKENTQATQEIPAAAAIAADKIVGAKIEEKREAESKQ